MQRLGGTHAFLFALLLLMLAHCATEGGQAQTLTVLHNFTGGGDGAGPVAGVTMDRAGNLYGTTDSGGYMGGECGAYGGCGTVYRLSHEGSSWTLTPLHIFQGSDGFEPYAGITIGPNGSLYGTTTVGGGSGGCQPGGCGTVFNLMPPAHFSAHVLGGWSQNVLYRFTGSSDGGVPGYGDVVFDLAGNIYGIANAVYKLTFSGENWTESVLSGVGGSPEGAVLFDHAGNIYSTTLDGGINNNGTVFQLTPNGSGWTLSTLYRFQGGSDGENPNAGVIMDAAGNLYGTTLWGGVGGGGTVYELSPSNGEWTHSILYGFSGSGASFNNLTMDAAGNLYGTATDDGAYGYGVVFELSPHPGGTWTYTDLHDFTGGTDGKYPAGSVVFDASGNLYSTTYSGGADGYGTVWEITP